MVGRVQALQAAGAASWLPQLTIRLPPAAAVELRVICVGEYNALHTAWHATTDGLIAGHIDDVQVGQRTPGGRDKPCQLIVSS